MEHFGPEEKEKKEKTGKEGKKEDKKSSKFLNFLVSKKTGYTVVAILSVIVFTWAMIQFTGKTFSEVTKSPGYWIGFLGLFLAVIINLILGTITLRQVKAFAVISVIFGLTQVAFPEFNLPNIIKWFSPPPASATTTTDARQIKPVSDAEVEEELKVNIPSGEPTEWFIFDLAKDFKNWQAWWNYDIYDVEFQQDNEKNPWISLLGQSGTIDLTKKIRFKETNQKECHVKFKFY